MILVENHITCAMNINTVMPILWNKELGMAMLTVAYFEERHFCITSALHYNIGITSTSDWIAQITSLEYLKSSNSTFHPLQINSNLTMFTICSPIRMVLHTSSHFQIKITHCNAVSRRCNLGYVVSVIGGIRSNILHILWCRNFHNPVAHTHTYSK